MGARLSADFVPHAVDGACGERGRRSPRPAAGVAQAQVCPRSLCALHLLPWRPFLPGLSVARACPGRPRSGLHALTAVGLDSVPGQGTRPLKPHSAARGEKKDTL